MSININNTSILPWYTNQRYQQHRKSYAQDQVWCLYSVLYRMPPFQIYRTNALGDPITSCVLTHIGTGNTFDVTTSIVADGNLEVISFTPDGETAYDLIVYPGNANFTDVALPEGQYDAVLSDGTNTWYSERFYMKSSLSNMIKLSYWHNRPFEIPLGHISYREPFYNFVYLPSEINRPKYEEEEEVETRDGYKFPIYMISYKKYRVVGLLIPEYLCDALRLVWMHTNVTLEFQGITYTTDSFRIIFDDFEKPGHLCPITIEFTTDTVITQTGYVEEESNTGDYDQSDYNDDHLIG